MATVVAMVIVAAVIAVWKDSIEVPVDQFGQFNRLENNFVFIIKLQIYVEKKKVNRQ